MTKYKLHTILMIILLVNFISGCDILEGKSNKIKIIKINSYFFHGENNAREMQTIAENETYEYDTNFNLIQNRQHTFKYQFDTLRNFRIKTTHNSNGETIKTELFKNDRNGRPIEAIEYGYKETKIKSKTILSYDSLGMLVDKSVYDENDSLIQKTNFEYNENKLEKKEFNQFHKWNFTSYHYRYNAKNQILLKNTIKDGNEIIRTEVYNYNNKGNTIKKIIYKQDETKQLRINKTIEYLYNDTNKIIEEVTTNGNSISKTTFEYYKDGRLKQISSSNEQILYSYDLISNKRIKTIIKGNNHKTWKEEDYFDNNGNKLKTVFIDTTNQVTGSHFYTYNESNQLVSESHMDSNSEVSLTVTFTYINPTLRYKKISKSKIDLEEQTQVLTILQNGSGKYEYLTFQALDGQGNIIEEATKFTLYQELEFKYENFDSRGNWLKRKVNNFGKSFRIDERIILYY